MKKYVPLIGFFYTSPSDLEDKRYIWYQIVVSGGISAGVSASVVGAIIYLFCNAF